MKYSEMIWENNVCNECNSNNDVKAITIGNYNLILCEKCRKELKKLLSK